MNKLAHFAFTVLLVVILTSCTTPAQTSATPVSSTEPSTPTPYTQSPFTNMLVYDPPEMYDVVVETVEYPTINGSSETLPMDIFYPSDRQPSELLPAVILVNGFPNDLVLQRRSHPVYKSWGRLIASEGLIAVAFDTRNENDLEAVINFIRQNGADFGIDSSNLGFWSSSSHSGLASSFAFQEGREYLKFAVFYYPWIMTPDNFGRQTENAVCVQYGCLGAQLPDVKQLRTDLPLLVVRSGKDSRHNIAIVDHFVELAMEAGVPLTLIRFDGGTHVFDWKAYSTGAAKDEAIKIIKQTLEFMKEHAYDQ